MPLLSAHDSGRRGPDPEEPAGLDDTEDLPLSQEEEASVIPDEERVIDVPS